MLIQISTDTHTVVDQPDVTAEVESGLSRYRERITRVEVHFSDVNGHRGGTDRRCKLEVRPAGFHPVAVSEDAGTAAEALTGAVQKMERLLASSLHRHGETRGGPSASGLPT